MNNTNENLSPETEEEQEHIWLTDEDGNEFPFDLMDVITYQDADYAVFFPADESKEDDDEDTEVVILKVIPNNDGSAEFEGTDDEETLDAVFGMFMENMRLAFEEDAHDDDCGCGHCHE